MADKFIQRFRYGNPSSSGLWDNTDQWSNIDGIGVDLDEVFKSGYEDPTYLTFRVEFGDWGTSLNGPTSKSNISTVFAAYASNYDELPIGLLDCNDNDDFLDKTQFYNAYNFLRSRNEDKRAMYLKAFRNGLYAISMKTPYIFNKISGIGSLGNFNQKGAMRVKDATITIDCIEGLDLKVKTLMTWYRKAAWDDIYQRWILPENMREFKMIIYIYEQRMFHHIDKDVHKQYEFAPALYNDDLNANLPVYALECEPCEFVIDNVFGDSYGSAFGDNQITTTLMKIKVKNVRTYLLNGLLPRNLSNQVIYDLQDLIDRSSGTNFTTVSKDNDGTYHSESLSVNSVKEKFMHKTIWDSSANELDKGKSWWYDVIMSGQLLDSDDSLFDKNTWKKLGKGILNIITSSKKHILGKGGVLVINNLATNIMQYIDFGLRGKYQHKIIHGQIYDGEMEFHKRYIDTQIVLPDFTDRNRDMDFSQPDMRERSLNNDFLEPDMSSIDRDMNMMQPDFTDRLRPDGEMPINNDERQTPELSKVYNQDEREFKMNMLEPDKAREVIHGEMPTNNEERKLVDTAMPTNNDGRTIVEGVMPSNNDERNIYDYVMPTNYDEREIPELHDVVLDGRDRPDGNLVEPDFNPRMTDVDMLEPDFNDREIGNDMMVGDRTERNIGGDMLEPDMSERTARHNLLEPDMSERLFDNAMLEPDMTERSSDYNMLEPDMTERSTSSQFVEMDKEREKPVTSLVEPMFDDRKVKTSLVEMDKARSIVGQTLQQGDDTERVVDSKMSKEPIEERTVSMDMLVPDMSERKKNDAQMPQLKGEERTLNGVISVAPLEERQIKNNIELNVLEPRKVENNISVKLDDERVVEVKICGELDKERVKDVLVMNRLEFTDVLSKATAKTDKEFDTIDSKNKEEEVKAKHLMMQSEFVRLDENITKDAESVQMVRLFTDEKGMLRESFIKRITTLQGNLKNENERIIRQSAMPSVEGVDKPKEDSIMMTPELKDRLVENAAMANIDTTRIREMSYQSLISLHENIENALEKTLVAQPIEVTSVKSKLNEKTNADKEVLRKTKTDDKSVHKTRPLLGHATDEPREKPKNIL